MKLKEFFIRILYPPKCIGCNRVLKISSGYPLICKHCRKEMMPLPKRVCPTCLKPLDVVADAPYCTYCANEKFNFNLLVSCGIYDNLYRSAVHNLKFNQRYHTAKSMAYMMYERLKSYDLCKHLEAICFAPISPKSLKERGFNQAQYIADELSLLLDIPVVDALIKIKDTEKQSLLSKKDRLNNLKDAIIFKREVKYKNVLFVDDVYTTGSTAEVCCNSLKKAGAKNIYVSVFAITKKEIEDERENY